jgi:hypothetical protein
LLSYSYYGEIHGESKAAGSTSKSEAARTQVIPVVQKSREVCKSSRGMLLLDVWQSTKILWAQDNARSQGRIENSRFSV